MFRERRSRELLPVIGEQMAQALRAEKARVSNSEIGPSPLPANLHYDKWSGDFDLSNPVKHPLDEQLRALCRGFAVSDLTSRSQFRNSASMDDFYTLLAFSLRSAVFAMRNGRAEQVVDGLTAIAMIEPIRIDFRDALVALSLLNHAGGVIGANLDDLFLEAAELAEPRMLELILGFQKKSQDYKNIRSWGYAVIETEAGPGFVGWGLESYQPTYPLDRIALRLAELVRQDRYGPARITVASDLPAVWLSHVDDNTLKRAVASIRGVVTVNAELRPEASPDYEHQGLILFLAELLDESSTRSLLSLSQEKQIRSNDFALVGVQEGRLFSLVIARSFIEGRASFENQASMRRFSTPIAEVLRRLA